MFQSRENIDDANAYRNIKEAVGDETQICKSLYRELRFINFDS